MNLNTLYMVINNNDFNKNIHINFTINFYKSFNINKLRIKTYFLNKYSII